jgi:hypothetical protein
MRCFYLWFVFISALLPDKTCASPFRKGSLSPQKLLDRLYEVFVLSRDSSVAASWGRIYVRSLADDLTIAADRYLCEISDE